jgi:hypothetical protein
MQPLLILLGCASTVGQPPPEQQYVPDLLQPIYDWNFALHSANRYKLLVKHEILSRAGMVKVQPGVAGSRPGFVDTPKELEWPGVRPGDVLQVFPSAEVPAVAEIRVPLTNAHFGPNRVRISVHTSGETCEGVSRTNTTTGAMYTEEVCVPPYDAVDGVVSAVLAPLSASHVVLRTVALRAVTLSGEWQEVLGDFYLLPDELGSGDSSMTLFVRLGDPRATVGVASATDLTVTTIPLENSALGKTVEATQPSASAVVDGRPISVPSSVLTNGEAAALGGQVWTLVDIGSTPVTIDFELDLGDFYFVCALQISWQSNSHISDWSFLYSSQVSGDSWSELLHVDTASEGSQPQVGSPDTRWFPCTKNVRRAKLHMARADNNIFMLTEVVLNGYELDQLGMCQTRCRHGGRCMYASEVSTGCTCVKKWGWRGPECNTDVNECALQYDAEAPQSEPSVRITQLGLSHAGNGGCGEGDSVMASCSDSPAGSWSCHCRPGYAGTPTMGFGSYCRDVDECLLLNGGCEHTCVNFDGGHRCSCRSGYELRQDGFSCMPRCSRSCEHGGLCLEPESCFGCDAGWGGDYCHEPACQVRNTDAVT